MTYQELPLFRATDPETSRQVSPIRVGSHRALLLEQYATATLGLTDEEAGRMSGLSSMPKCCYWKRCGELRQAGYIQPTGETRMSTAGVEQQVCMITIDGMKAVVGLV